MADEDIRRQEPNWEGVGGEHRTVGSHRAWCYECSEWCYRAEGMHCRHCEEPAPDEATMTWVLAAEPDDPTMSPEAPI